VKRTARVEHNETRCGETRTERHFERVSVVRERRGECATVCRRQQNEPCGVLCKAANERCIRPCGERHEPRAHAGFFVEPHDQRVYDGRIGARSARAPCERNAVDGRAFEEQRRSSVAERVVRWARRHPRQATCGCREAEEHHHERELHWTSIASDATRAQFAAPTHDRVDRDLSCSSSVRRRP
jgi:hypothetical protein